MAKVRISVIVPCFNEVNTVLETLRGVWGALEGVGSPQVIVVDDGSTDGSAQALESHPELVTTLIRHPRNRGKGAAISTALRVARGEMVIIQDADAEYYAEDWPAVLRPLLEGEADVVYGRRPLKGLPGRPVIFGFATRSFSWLASRLSGLRVRDIATCYKAFRTDVLRGLELEENGFSWDAEVTVKLGAVERLRYAEVDIRYRPRDRRSGKKLAWWHGFRYAWALFRYGLPVSIARWKQ